MGKDINPAYYKKTIKHIEKKKNERFTKQSRRC